MHTDAISSSFRPTTLCCATCSDDLQKTFLQRPFTTDLLLPPTISISRISGDSTLDTAIRLGQPRHPSINVRAPHEESPVPTSMSNLLSAHPDTFGSHIRFFFGKMSRWHSSTPSHLRVSLCLRTSTLWRAVHDGIGGTTRPILELATSIPNDQTHQIGRPSIHPSVPTIRRLLRPNLVLRRADWKNPSPE